MFLEHQYKLFCRLIGLGAFGCLKFLLEAQVLSEVEEVLSFKWRPVVATNDHGYSK